MFVVEIAADFPLTIFGSEEKSTGPGWCAGSSASARDIVFVLLPNSRVYWIFVRFD